MEGGLDTQDRRVDDDRGGFFCLSKVERRADFGLSANRVRCRNVSQLESSGNG